VKRAITTFILKTLSALCDLFEIEFPPIPSVSAIIVKKGKILVVQVNGNKYTLPGGKLREKETYEMGLERETLEETGMKIKNLKFFNKYPCKVDYPTINYTFTADVDAGELKPSSEGIPMWLNLPEIKNKFIYLDNKLAMTDYFSKNK